MYNNTQHHALLSWASHAQLWVALKWQNRFSEDASLRGVKSLPMAPSRGGEVLTTCKWLGRSQNARDPSGHCCVCLSLCVCILQMCDSVGQSGLCKMDLEHTLGIVGIVATVLNLLVVVFVYVFTPVWPASTPSGHGRPQVAAAAATGRVWGEQEAAVCLHSLLMLSFWMLS